MLDEPTNGLDPAGIRWMRGLLRSLAAEGRTVFVSSHLMNEVSLTADQVVVIGRGRILADRPLAELTDAPVAAVRVRTPDPARLSAVLGDAATLDPDDAQTLIVRSLGTEHIARTALAHQIPIHELTPLHPSLEDAYLALTTSGGATERPSATADPTTFVEVAP
jgi:ABC-2 type transport system ATP-binding protein